MSLRGFCWSLFLAGLPFAPFLDRRIDLWHAQTMWASAWIPILFALSCSKSHQTVRNRPLAFWMVWVALSSWWIWQQTMIATKTYPTMILMPVMHMILIVLAVRAFQVLETFEVRHLITAIAISGCVVMAYSGMQLLGLDQFFSGLGDPKNHQSFVGTIGNPSHYGSYLAFLIPFLVRQDRWGWWAGSVALLLSVVSGSVGAIAASYLAWMWCSWHGNRRVFYGSLLAIPLGLIWVHGHQSFLSDDHRFAAWTEFYKLFKQQPITGMGPGYVMAYSTTLKNGDPLFTWRHVHHEWFQIAIEYGVIGLIVLVWAFVDALRNLLKQRTPESVAAIGVLLAFLVNSQVNYCTHLWMSGSLVLVAYALAYRESECRNS